jgi:hypothetical protein
MMATMLNSPLRDLPVPQRHAILERLAATLERNAGWAATEGDDALELVLRSVGGALRATAGDLAATELWLAEDVCKRAAGLIMTFHLRYPDYPVGQALH